MNIIPEYPVYTPLSWDMLDELYPLLNNLSDGISEFTFPSLYLHRYKYNYKISKAAKKDTAEGINLPCYILIGEYNGNSFFSLPCAIPQDHILASLIAEYKVWKNMSQEQCDIYGSLLSAAGYTIIEDRNNFDYVYDRTSLMTLAGKQLYKKKTHVTAFLSLYKAEVKPLNSLTKDDALYVLEQWKQLHEGESDYASTKEALQCVECIKMSGIVVYADDKPAAFAIGEPVANHTMMAVHFEKGIDSYKGIYQYVNKAYAEHMDTSIIFINREQDLGSEGLRQAKLTYRPIRFVKKYQVVKK